MLLTENEVFELLQVELLHVDLLFPGALGVIVLVTLGILAFDSSSAPIFLADETLVLESLFLDVLDALDADDAVLFLEVALGHPDGTYIVHPHVMAYWCFSRVCRFYEVVIIALFLFLTSFSNYLDDVVVVLLILCLLSFNLRLWNVLFFLLVVRTFLRVLIVTWVRLLEQVYIDVY
jgi:hypothetical protein